MCGIAGILQSPARGYRLEHLKKMTDSLAHRGPDGEGLWQNEEGSVFLGHRRLSVIDLSDAGRQPMPFRDRYRIIHNGEIYNYIELRNELAGKGYAFRTQTDTEVIAAAYDCWKEECVDRFDGMFAFAIWDNIEKTLFAARDRFGEKPFFYSLDEKQFLFASEMKALWAAGISQAPNQKLLFNFLTIGYTDNPEIPGETFFENIYKLPSASWLKFSLPGFQCSIVNYWDIDVNRVEKNISDGEALEQFGSLLKDSVKKRLRSDVSLGTSLSGGLDSSSIGALCRELSSPAQSFKCFTATFEGFEKDESVYAKQVADRFDLQQYLAPITAEGFLSDWGNICKHQEEPVGSAGIYAQYKVFELAGRQGVKVLLDGQGADEILAGYHKYYKWYWQELFRNRRLSRSRELKAARELGVTESFNFKNRIAAWFPGFAAVVLERQYLLKAIRQEDLSREFVQQYSKGAYYTPPEHFTLNGVLYFNTRTHGLEELLRYADRNSMAHGREVRLPFLSHELVEFVFSVPSHFKIRQGWTKWLLREFMKNKLPGDIVWRKDKVGFEVPQRQWMEQPAVQEAIRAGKQKLVNEKILKPSVMDKKIIPLSSYEPNNYDWRYFSAASLFK